VLSRAARVHDPSKKRRWGDWVKAGITRRSQGERFSSLMANFDRAALDPAAWENVCDDIAGLLDATGVLLTPVEGSGKRAEAMPHSRSLGEACHRYVEGGWYARDFRITAGAQKVIRDGYLTDQELIAPEAMKRHPYYAEFLNPLGIQWCMEAAFGVGDSFWVASVHRGEKGGAFQKEEVETVLRLRRNLTIAAKRTAVLGRERLESLEKAFATAKRGLIGLDAWGRISWLNPRAEELVRRADLASHSRLRMNDPLLHARLSDLVDAAIGFRWSSGLRLPGPLLAPAGDGDALSIDAVPMPHDFQALLSGVTVLVTMHEVSAPSHGPAMRLRERFGLTAREVELAEHLISGRHVSDAATEMQVTVATVRQHLKSIFSKTGTHRQGELVALLTRSKTSRR